MNLNALRYVVEVAEEGNMTRAAQKLYVSQPSLSQAIQGIERELGAQLFHRGTNPLQLTHAGEVYVEWARQVLLSRQQMGQRIDDILADRVTRVIVGISSERSLHLMPPVLERFRALRPDCLVVLEENPTDVLHDLLARALVDITVGVAHPDSVQYDNTVVAGERILLAVPKAFGVRAAGDGAEPYPAIPLRALQTLPFVHVDKDQNIGMLIHNICAKEGFAPLGALRVRSSEMAHKMAARGFGITPVPEFAVKYSGGYDTLDYFTIQDYAPMRDLSVSRRKDRYLTGSVQQFIDVLRQVMGE